MRRDAEAIKTHLMDDNEVDGPLFKMRTDPRVTTIGRIIRKTSLDEIPQLFNVVVGQMSLVGPRPFVTAESDQIEGWAKRRFEVRPGITGLWQVSGRNDLSFEDLERLDYVYVASWSLSWDIKILSQTPGSVIGGHGAY
jgi:lipopolysaccharide/colanic/teichoic acid biosynthesis glycosyltransferase